MSRVGAVVVDQIVFALAVRLVAGALVCHLAAARSHLVQSVHSGIGRFGVARVNNKKGSFGVRHESTELTPFGAVADGSI